MQIVTDSGSDVGLSPEELAELNIHIVPLVVTLNGVQYREGVDIEHADFYPLLEATDSLPTTSQPSAGDFAETYRQLAATDPDILSIHISSGLSGTYNSAVAAADMVPEANVTVVDTKTLSAGAGWEVRAAARAAKAGWGRDQILPLIENIRAATNSIYTLAELKYLIHGGRISHMKGLVAGLLSIKPMIGVEHEGGTYQQLGQARKVDRALQGLVGIMEKTHAPGSSLRVQVLHSNNPEGAQQLRSLIDARFDCTWLPTGPMSLVLGAHTGGSMVGVAYAPEAVFTDIPEA